MPTLEEVFKEAGIVTEVRNLATHALRTMNLPEGGTVSVSDLSSDLLTRLWERVKTRGHNPNFDHRGQAFAYLTTCVTRDLISRLRQRATRPTTVPLTEELANFLSDGEAKTTLESVQVLEQAFTHLLAQRDATTGEPLFDEIDAAIFRGKAIFSLSFPHLAVQFGRTEHEVKTAYDRVRANLNRYLTSSRPAS